MFKSRLTRVAVNVCVASALLLPPGGWNSMASKACASEASSSSKATCGGCGHCSVNAVGELCGCCCRRGVPDTNKNVASHQTKSCCHRAKSTIAKQIQSAGDHIESICLCGLEQAPAAPVPQTSNLSEQIVLALLSAPALGQTNFADETVFARGALYSSPPALSPHDSQLRFCVWLI